MRKIRPHGDAFREYYREQMEHLKQARVKIAELMDENHKLNLRISDLEDELDECIQELDQRDIMIENKESEK